jgi:hypothetical protein
MGKAFYVKRGIRVFMTSLLSPKEQKLLKPPPEVIAAEVLSENMQKDVKELCDCIRANNLRIKWEIGRASCRERV